MPVWGKDSRLSLQPRHSFPSSASSGAEHPRSLMSDLDECGCPPRTKRGLCNQTSAKRIGDLGDRMAHYGNKTDLSAEWLSLISKRIGSAGSSVIGEREGK